MTNDMMNLRTLVEKTPDADHEYEGTLNAVRTWSRKLTTFCALRFAVPKGHPLLILSQFGRLFMGEMPLAVSTSGRTRLQEKSISAG
ncbi:MULTISPECIES: hypothetical protein [Mesorhizobium]|uniref:hypothetical protein n=1 Tax=Mesorhizobium sp. TaxID=1871066 RepID=UPI0004946DCF|nr:MULTISPECIES: hypothetical protein [Mesorhizobium]RWM75663.1 MAG: hypothetical protein EOR82_03225 [Mesorhizobium sp.]TIO25268.1 MAG: hypothetical protein E5X83_13720 [Mesorhizobium sp.]TJV58765.1 MAG: hypothetical protein E5X82_17150 [Mesorhizobium sp.]